jgi:hypothetical protein
VAPARAAIRRVHRVRPRHPHPHRLTVASRGASYSQTRYVLRPIACGVHPAAALMSPLPGVAAPATPQQLLAELAGPPAAASPETAIDTAASAPAAELPAAPETAGSSPGDFLPAGGGPLGPGGGVFGPGGPGIGPEGPGGVTSPIIESPVPPPGAPQVTPVTPGGPGGVSPPVGPIVETGVPGLPGLPGGVGGVPEPASWSLLLVGFFGLGGALRRQRRARV